MTKNNEKNTMSVTLSKTDDRYSHGIFDIEGIEIDRGSILMGFSHENKDLLEWIEKYAPGTKIYDADSCVDFTDKYCWFDADKYSVRIMCVPPKFFG